MESIIESVLISSDTIREKVKELGAQISRDYEGNEIILVGVLKGGFVFLADLIREITIPVEMDFISVSSYGSSTKSSGVVRIIKDIDVNISGKHIIIVEDIIDTGLTIRHLKELLSTRSPKSVKVCTIFDKPSRRKVEIEAEYQGLIIPDKFVIGYGLDYDEKYRNLPDLCVLSPKVYSK